MRIPRLIPELPLLRRELIELSARRRTYIVRSLGALVLLGWVVYLLNSSMSELMQYQLQGAARGGGMRGMSLMGAGSILFPRLVPSLFMAVQLLMPSLVCGSITTEKERNTSVPGGGVSFKPILEATGSAKRDSRVAVRPIISFALAVSCTPGSWTTIRSAPCC